jgi:hypothetical protein
MVRFYLSETNALNLVSKAFLLLLATRFIAVSNVIHLWQRVSLLLAT